jgi:regulator of sirC expression with transglutaminase-like and TPR domain
MSTAFTKDSQFRRLLDNQSEVDLVRLMLEFASDAYNDLDWLECLCEIDRLGHMALQRVSPLPEADLRSRLREVSRLLYDDEGFHGNRSTYHDPRNSYLNDVLARRCGIPISLGILYMAVARAAGLPVYGISTPGHFVLGCQQAGRRLYIDAFSDGDLLRYDQCVERIECITGQSGVLRREHFRPACPREIAVRVLRNLKAAYALQNDWPAVLPVQKRLALLLPHAADEQRDLGLVYLRNGQSPAAIELLEAYARCTCPEQARQIEPYLRTARRMRAELN